MVYLTSLWLPIAVAAVFVFIVSSVIHMLTPFHKNDYAKLPNESAILAAIRKENVLPGAYAFPHLASPKDMGSPEMLDKYTQGPVGMLRVVPNGPPPMPKHLVQWFVYCLIVGTLAGYLAGRTVGDGASYLAVFRVVGTAAWLGYGIGSISDSIWRAEPWRTTAKNVFDGLIYALVTAGVFGWLWPR